MAATTIARTNIGTNDDGSGTTGTVINTAYIGLIYDNIDALFSSTTGIRLNQAAGSGPILNLESSDVAHGMTSLALTNVYGYAAKSSATAGGMTLVGLTETTIAVDVQGYCTTDDTTKSTAGVAPIRMTASLKSGTSAGAQGANSNIAVIQTNGATRFIFDSDGESHQDIGTGWITFDDHDDVALLTSLEGELAGRDALKAGFHDWMTYSRQALAEARVVTFNDDGHHFVNFTRLTMVLCGSIRQLAAKLKAAEDRVLAIEGTR